MNSSKAQYRLLMVTHVPFWRGRNGAAIRVSGIVEEMKRRGYRVKVVYAEHLFASQRAAAKACGIEEITSVVSWKRGILRHLRENLSPAAVNCLKSVRSVYRRLTGYSPPPPARLEDWRIPGLAEAAASECQAFKPDVVLVEYAAFAYVREALSGDPVTVIDTHDVMHLRQQAYDRQGIPHWLNVTREEEAQALRPFDVVLAIQKEEAEVFRDMLPDARVVTCPPWFEPVRGSLGAESSEGDAPLILFVASRMEANWKGLEEFLGKAWPLIRQGVPQCRLRVCGTVCERFSGRAFRGVEFGGFVKDLGDEYARAQVIVSPVTFGGGIKIKCLEALAYGKPCVISAHSALGFKEAAGSAFLMAGSWEDFADKVCALLGDSQRMRDLGAAATRLIAENFSREACLAPLLQAIDAVRAERKERSRESCCS